jgi:hypothetical protein
VNETEAIGTYKVGGIAGGKMGAIIGERGSTLRKLEADSGLRPLMMSLYRAPTRPLIIVTPYRL